MSTVLIVAGQRLVREGLRALIQRHAQLEVVGEAEDGSSAVDQAAAGRPDFVVLEAALPRLSGIEAVRRIKGADPQCRCIVSLPNRSAELVREALLAGADGLVEQSGGFGELLEALDAVRHARRYLAPALGGCIADAFGRGSEAESASPSLSARQREVLGLIAAGRTTRQIASDLGISLKTAQTHRAKLMGRLGVHKASSLVRFAIREGIIAA